MRNAQIMRKPFLLGTGISMDELLAYPMEAAPILADRLITHTLPQLCQSVRPGRC